MQANSTLIHSVAQSDRLQPYRLIHKAVRAEMAGTLLAAGRTDPHDEAALQALQAQVDDLLRLVDKHLQTENAFMHPALRERLPRVAQEFDDEHAAQRDAAQLVRGALDALRAAGPGDAAQPALYRLYLELSTWVAHHFEHMADEETSLTLAFWDRFGDDELHAIEQRIVASFPPQDLQAMIGLILRSLNHAERVGWLRPMSEAMPRDAFGAVLDQAQRVLGTGEWHKLARAFNVPAVPGLVAD